MIEDDCCWMPLMLLVLVRIVKAMIRLAVAVAGLRSKDLMTIAMMTDG